MSEDALWLNVRDKMAPFGRMCRIENRVDLGTPDFFYTITGVSGWCELKHKPHWPEEATTPLVLPKLTLMQVTWIEDEHKAGGRVSMLVQVGTEYVFADAVLTRAVYERTVTRESILTTCPERFSRTLDRRTLHTWLTKCS